MRNTAHNIGLAIWRLKCFYEIFVQGSTAVILLNFCAKNPPHRQAVNRCGPLKREEQQPKKPKLKKYSGQECREKHSGTIPERIKKTKTDF